VAGFSCYPAVGMAGFYGSIVDGFGASGTSGSGSFYGPSLGAGGFSGSIVGCSVGSFGSGGLSIGGIQEYFKNSSEVTSGFSNPSKPISILLGVNSSTLVTKPAPYLNPFENYFPSLSVTLIPASPTFSLDKTSILLTYSYLGTCHVSQ